MQIGVTERGDPVFSIDKWVPKLNKVDGAIIITKAISSSKLRKAIIKATKPIIVHCTITGWGGSVMEPNVPDFVKTLYGMKSLIDEGFNPKNIVLRIDPIIPSEKGLILVNEVLKLFTELNLGVNRIRISVLDYYPHVTRRMEEQGISSIYNNLYPNFQRFEKVIETLLKYDYKYETCAEDDLINKSDKFIKVGCLGYKDLELMGLDTNIITSENPQGRKGCHCLGFKTELLTFNQKIPCPHKCQYCFLGKYGDEEWSDSVHRLLEDTR